MVVLESLDHARRRDAPIVGELVGYASSADAWRLTDSHPEGRGAVRAMQGALDDAELEPDRVDYINAHGTSTVVNDRVEALAIHSVFGDRAASIPVSSFKSMIGHATVGAGAIELVGTICALQSGALPPNRNLAQLDPRIELNVIHDRALEGDFDVAVSNSFGFGGQNASLVVKRFER